MSNKKKLTSEESSIKISHRLTQTIKEKIITHHNLYLLSGRPLKHLLFLILITFSVYFNSLSNGFVYDDFTTITNNQFIRDWGNLPKLFSSDYFVKSGEATYRPVVTLSYFIDYTIWQLKPYGYHLTNVIIHAANVLLVYLFIGSFVADLPVRCTQTGRNTAFLAALLFAVHPVQSEAVNAISFREDLLIVFFLLLSFLLFLRVFNIVGIDKAKTGISHTISLIFYLLALFSKEMAITFPLLLLFSALTFQPSAFRISHFIGYLVVTVFYLFIYLSPLSNPNPAIFPYPDVWIRLMNIPYVLIRYLYIILYPSTLNADYVFVFSHSLTEPFVFISLLIILGVGVFVYLLMYRKDNPSPFSSPLSGEETNKFPLPFGERVGVRGKYLFFLSWFFIGLLSVMNIIPVEHVMAERYLYLPFIGIAAFVSMYLMNTYKKWQSSTLIRKGIIFGVIAVVAALSIRTFYRNYDWKDEFTLWSKTVIVSPNSSMSHNNLGNVYLRQKDYEAAIREYQTAIKIRPDHLYAYNNLGMVYAIKRDYEAAIREYQTAIKINPDYSDAHNNLGNVYLRQKDYEAAIKEYQTTIKINPDYLDAHNNLGIVYERKGNYEAAMREYQTAIKINPDHPDAHNNLGNIYLRQRDYEAAIKEYQTTIKINPDHPDAHNNLGIVYERKGDYEAAIKEYQTTIKINPDHPDAHNNLGIVYERKGDYEAAIKEYQTAIKINPDHPDAHNNLALIYYKQGRLKEAHQELSITLSIDPNHGQAKKGIEILRQRMGQGH